MMKNLQLVSAILLAAGALATGVGAELHASPAHAQVAPPKGGTPKLPRVEGLRTYGVQQLVVPAGIPESADITVLIDGKPEVIHLVRTSLRGEKAKLLLAGAMR